ncbi:MULTISPECIES: enoyl-CoA hydratase/isomerase family protein [unclassified Flavobacterium]|uniref:enoyl-CoA hydratase/isomerase family protein n=1 Tax=unclassified Flavobacterium TaxID=196869 RepID=UPI001F13F839|nr:MULTISPECIES: enoyl-CoA hydratase/isomerase family protein [unclassified Flavobacterium]UMY66266.1 enoyl-CoA hydratase/isomerase family protein [Flavobacterium sp. HJ-32-4]
MSDSGSISVSIRGNAAYVTFGHPAGNSFPSSQLLKLTEALGQLAHDPAVALVVLQSSGDGAFCAGASFDELLSISDPDAGTRFFSGFANVINAMRQCPKPIIGRVQGKAVGGGVGLAAACDYVFATHAASVRLSELAIGIGPFVIAPAVERKVGKSGLAELSFAPSEWKDATWALQRGLFSRLCDDIASMDVALDNFIETLGGCNPEALSEMKKALWEGTDHWGTLLYERAAISGSLVLSDFTRQALEAFRKK